MIVKALINAGLPSGFARAVVIIGLGAISGALMAVVQAGQVTGVLLTIAPFIAAFITGVAALLNTNPPA